MKHSLIAALTATCIFACSTQPVKEHSFYISFSGQEGSVEGHGSTSKEAAKDALRYMNKNVWKGPMQALPVVMRDEDTGEVFKGVVLGNSVNVQ